MPGGRCLVDFVDASVSGDAGALASARQAVVDALGAARMLEASAVIGNFSMMVRIADATGTPLDKGSVEMSADLRREMGLDAYRTARIPD